MPLRVTGNWKTSTSFLTFIYLSYLIMFVSGAGYVYHRAYVPTYRGSLHSEIKPEQNTNKTSLNYVAISWCLTLWELAFLLPCGPRSGVGCSGEIRLSVLAASAFTCSAFLQARDSLDSGVHMISHACSSCFYISSTVTAWAHSIHIY